VALGGARRFSVRFFMHSIICVAYGLAHTPSLPYAGYCRPCKLGRFCGGMGHSEYPGAKVYFNDCLEE
jgi:hypothetical protein